MASKFTAGMKNFVEVLNQMWDAFAAGPYNALPLTGGNLTGPVTSSSRITAQSLVATQVIAGATAATSSSIQAANGDVSGVQGAYYEVLAQGVAGVPGLAYPGRFYWSTSSGIGSLYASGYRMVLRAADSSGTTAPTGDLLTISAAEGVGMPTLTVGRAVSPALRNHINRGAAQGEEILYVGQYGAPAPSIGVLASDGNASWTAPTAVLYVGRNSTSARSISTGGTINASGADYAEYLVKSRLCGLIVPGQIVGIDIDGKLTDKWDLSITFMTKSTSPCMVGGDSWAQDMGARPAASQRGEDDTDDTWAAKELEHASALAAFDIALEQRRQTVDRIAFAGQVPVNVLGATPGQYIVPVQEGEGIAGQAVDRGDMTLDQYMSAIGRVIAIEEDGRARIIVKVA